jgi:hypothetical protein
LKRLANKGSEENSSRGAMKRMFNKGWRRTRHGGTMKRKSKKGVVREPEPEKELKPVEP